MRDDLYYMQLAYANAYRGLYSTYPNPAVGCVIVRDGQILGEGYHQKAGCDHAEIRALKACGQSVAGATAYVTLEPCCHYGRTPPCALRLAKERVARVVYACEDPNPKVAGGGRKILEEAGIEVESGVLDQQCRFLNRAFFYSIVRKRPYVTVKIGMSLDARTALASGESKWITAADSRALVQDLRAKCDVLLTGSETVIKDDPRLNVRYEELDPSVQAFLPEKLCRQPLKVVLDTRARLNPQDYQLFKSGRVLWCVGGESLFEEQLSEGLVKLTLPLKDGHVDFALLLDYLGSKQYRRLLVEAGATLTGFVLRHFAQELYVYQAPKLLGLEGRPAFLLPSPDSLSMAQTLSLHRVNALASGDLRLHYLLNRT
ncbi:MAG: bifunctional diaminohydroxyphosphoribosylaminopyrimidine deaminase/5-amino-6-(5-phosphoribosylamino)uracil reductase RibD [Succinivibrio sp.]|nr:bifunctional diaminohydroxyphosphoribosylaminopyrimidine deaminase/5-amino-6-(5-phosphoribosylamino)uracil reductase RibD [Succinivibrio sp.]